jgi:hypothetical protein
MRLIVLALLPALLFAAPALQIVRPIVSMMDDGTADPPGFEHVPGEVLHFSCRVTGYAKSPESQVQLVYTIQAFDAKGVPLVEEYKNELVTEVSPQDKDWMPKIATEIALPPLIAAGTYKVVVKVDDVQAKTAAEATVNFLVRAREVAPSETLVVRNFRFFRSEDDEKPVPKASYRPGDAVWARFDITGYKFGEKNSLDVSYVTSVIAPTGRLLWTQPEPAAEKTQSFYPQRYVPAAMGINLQNTIRPGEYTIAVQVKDAIGNQSHESKYTFTVE